MWNRIGGRAGGGGGGGSNKRVCQFYLEGRCKFGDSCHNYHPPGDQTSASSTQNRDAQQLPYHLNLDSIKSDLTTGDERPAWPLSAFGPGRDAPRELLEGALEQSPEELRVLYYLAKAGGGSTAQYETNERQALDEANQQAQRILADLEGAIKYVIDGKDQHPNREDVVLKNTAPFPWVERPELLAAGQSVLQGVAAPFGGGQRPSAFGSGAQQPSTFGQASGLGGSGGAFGKPSFGQASQAASQPAFGQTSAFGAAGSSFGKPSPLSGGAGGGSAFGQASQLGGGGQPSAFGQASQLGSGSAFSKPSSLGGASPFAQAASSNTTGTSAFGQPSQPGGGAPAFGQTSSFGAASSDSSPFGKPSPFATSTSQAPTTGSAFEQASTPGQQQSSPFGQVSQPVQQRQQSAFGQPSQPGQAPSTFGKPSPFGSGNTGSAFGQQSTSGSQPTAFGQTSAFGASQKTSPFGQQQPPPGQQQSPFSSGSGNQTNSTTGQPPIIQKTGPPTAAHPKGQRISTWKGRQVKYENGLPFYGNDKGKQERIWLPDGQDDVLGTSVDVEAPPGTYDDTLGAALKQVYDFVRENGMFKDGLVPEIPPKREWVRWDL